MKFFYKVFILTVFMAGSTAGFSQVLSPGEKVPSGAIVYSLPSTTFHIVAEAEYESFTAGPYARYAQKYLGIAAKEESGNFFNLRSVEMIPYIEADPSVNIALNLGSAKNASANFLEMINQGLIVWSDSYAGKKGKIRFPEMSDPSVFDKAMSTANLASEQATLYRTVNMSPSMERIAVQQNQLVEKSPERRAEEIANLIFRLREKKMDIITGETDATLSGDALRAAVEELNRLENEYLSLFLGKSEYSTQRLSFDVVPKRDIERQMYIAFRVSYTQGLLPANNLSGRPIVLEFTAEENPAAPDMDTTVGRGRIVYRKPLMMTAKLSDGQSIIIQTRVPVYQLGVLMSFPIEVATGKL